MVRTSAPPVPMPADTARTATAVARVRRPRARASRAASAAQITARASAPPRPSSQGSCTAGHSETVSAVDPTHCAGTQASAVAAVPTSGMSAATHATIPATVASGAAGPAIMFAITPCTDIAGVMRMRIGAQASCAASGTEIATASGVGSTPARVRASGRASTMRASVAATESAKPRLDASHGSAISTTVTAVPSTARPCDRRPVTSATRPITDIPAARTTLASGVTSTTNAARTSTAMTTRHARDAPHSAAKAKAAATTMTQFEPETAVRWLRPVAFIAASRSSSTALVSPTARPGTSAPPDPGNADAARTSPCRRSAAMRNTPAGGSTTVGGRASRTSSTARVPGSLGVTAPRSSTTVPRSRSAARSPVNSTDTVPCTGASRPVTSASKRHAPDHAGSTFVVTTPRKPPASVAPAASSPRDGSRTATEVSTSAAAMTARVARTRTGRATTSAHAPAAPHTPIASGVPCPAANTPRSAAVHAAIGSASARSALTLAPDLATPRASFRRCPGR